MVENASRKRRRVKALGTQPGGRARRVHRRVRLDAPHQTVPGLAPELQELTQPVGGVPGPGLSDHSSNVPMSQTEVRTEHVEQLVGGREMLECGPDELDVLPRHQPTIAQGRRD